MRDRPLKPLREQLNELFTLHIGERRGFFAMAILMVLLSSWVVLEQWVLSPPGVDPGPFRKEMEVWLAARAQAAARDTVLPEPFPFDPNTIDRPQWLALGFSERQVDGIERYMAKGGHFRTKRDLSRLYSISSRHYAHLEPFIQLPDELPVRAPRERRYGNGGATTERREDAPGRVVRSEPRQIAKVEVNTADSAALVALPGIGPAFAKGIIKYRDLLGGYVHLDQLGEVHVLKDKPDALERIRGMLVVDTLAIRRIPINSCTVEELGKHPYIDWTPARALINYRTQHGPFRELADIRGCVLIDEALFRKLAPYLSEE